MTPLDQKDHKRILGVVLFLFAAFSILYMQFFRIQIVEGEKWERQANRQHFFSVKETFKRGEFISSNAKQKHHTPQRLPFVRDVQMYHLFIDPKSIPEEVRDDISGHFIAMLDLPVEQHERCRRQFLFQSRSRKVSEWLDASQVESVQDWWFEYAKEHAIPKNAIYFVSAYRRSHPYDGLLGQVLHTTQALRDEETGRATPTGGLELSMNHLLSGNVGSRLMMRSPRHNFETGRQIVVPKDGSTITLTINHFLQAITEEELEKGVKIANAKRGWAVMMDPKNGHLLAVAEYPFFDPNHYSDYFTDPEKTEAAKTHFITDANEPGSVMKALTMLIALKANEELEKRGEAPLFDPNEKRSVENTKFSGRSKPIIDLTPRKWINMDMALQKSSNVYPSRLVEEIIQKLGAEWYRHQLVEWLELGKKTGIELPAESPGLVPRIGKLHPNGKPEWSKSTPYSLAIGHNIQLTAIQLVKAFALLANRGYLVQPTLIEAIDGVPVDHPAPVRRVDERLVNRVIHAMSFVSIPGGTAWRAKVPGYSQAGKTGTANKIVDGSYSQKEYVASYIGFTPADHPEFVLLVTLDEPECRYIPGQGKNHHGGFCTTPIFKAIARRSLQYLGVPEDDPFGYPVGDPRRDLDQAWWAQERRLLQEKVESWNN